MKHRAWSVFLVASSLVVVGVGCNPFQAAQDKIEKKIGEKVTESIIEKTAGGNVNVDLKGDNGVVMKDNKTGDVMMFGEDIEIPENFPKVVPRYAGAKAISVTLDGASTGGTLGLSTSDSVAKVTAWYVAKMKADGWTESQSYSAGTSEIRLYEKGKSSLTLTVSTSEEDKDKGQTTIYIVFLASM